VCETGLGSARRFGHLIGGWRVSAPASELDCITRLSWGCAARAEPAARGHADRARPPPGLRSGTHTSVAAGTAASCHEHAPFESALVTPGALRRRQRAGRTTRTSSMAIFKSPTGPGRSTDVVVGRGKTAPLGADSGSWRRQARRMLTDLQQDDGRRRRRQQQATGPSASALVDCQ
jgi:hypothetical protein